MRLLVLVIVVIATLSCSSGDEAGSPSPTANSGIAGSVVAGPTCPVERPESPCPDRPLDNAPIRIDFLSTSDTSPVYVTSDSGGHFRVNLPPGTYKVTPLPLGSAALPSPGQPEEVTVSAGQFASVTLTYDTGIR